MNRFTLRNSKEFYGDFGKTGKEISTVKEKHTGKEISTVKEEHLVVLKDDQ